MNKIKTTTKIAIFILIMSGILFTKNTHAQIGVPISTQLDFQSIMNFQKNFTLDRVATMVAKQILHQITVSVVNWINSGFEGSPLFLSNPGGFFLDVADQITGAFIATNGPLSSLCSPFAIDIRLGLALSQTTLATQRYRCTLGEIIRVQSRGPDIIVNGQVVRSQGTMNGFLGGDFNQGGWPAFISLTTEPQNNPYGAFLKAEGELKHRIIAGQNVIKADLQLGNGFMSWPDCKEVPQGTLNPEKDPSIKVVNNGDGTVTYKKCEVKTPGSVIAGSLEKNLNVPVTELELANNINAVIDALMSQMMKKVIGGGLSSLSGGSAGGTSFTQQVIESTYTGQEVQQTLDGLRSAVASAVMEVDTSLSLYRKSISALTETERRLNEAKSCMLPKSARVESFGNRISEIDLFINSDIKPMLAELNAKKASAEEVKNKLDDITISLAGSGSSGNINTQLAEYNRLTQSGALYAHQRYGGAAAKFNEIEGLTKTQNAKAEKYLKECALIP